MLNKVVLTMALALMCASSAWALDCRSERLAASTPTSNFIGQGEVVTDNHTSLSWMRCAVGQQWSGKTCEGEPTTLTWQEAMAIVAKVNQEGLGGYNDWRMPLVPELASIVERQCFNPRMNTAIFPGAPSAIFWSAMEKMGSATHAYTLDFGGGAAMASIKQGAGAVRLARGGPWWQPPAIMAKR